MSARTSRPAPRPAASDAPHRARGGLSLAVVRGCLSSAPEVRVLGSGARLATLQVTARRASGPAVSVPLAVWEPATWVERLEEGDEVVALGVVRRRFYRRSGATASRVEVEVESLARPGDRRRVGALRRRVDAAVEALGEPGR